MRFDNAFADRQTEACANNILKTLHSIKFLKDTLDIFFGDPWAAVFYGDHHPVTVVVRVQRMEGVAGRHHVPPHLVRRAGFFGAA